MKMVGIVSKTTAVAPAKLTAPAVNPVAGVTPLRAMVELVLVVRPPVVKPLLVSVAPLLMVREETLVPVRVRRPALIVVAPV